MKEIIQIHIGQAGLQLGTACWETFCLDQNIQFDGTIKQQDLLISQKEIEVNNSNYKLFQESKNGKYTPRAILIDSEPSIIDNLQKGQFKNLFKQTQYIVGKEDSANIFSRGYDQIGKQLIDLSLDQIRKQLEFCDNIDGFLLYHSIGGGTGSGFMSYLLQQLNELYGNKSIFNFTLFPSQKLSTSIVEPYNATLALQNLIEYSNACIIYDNEPLYNICQNKLDVESPQYSNINRIIAQAINLFTTSMRHGGPINQDMNSFLNNLVPYNRLHFLMNSYAPYYQQYKAQFDSINIQQITKSAFHTDNQISKFKIQGRYIACNLMFRGDIQQKDILDVIDQIKQEKNKNYKVKFTSWCLTPTKVCINSQQPLFIKNGDLAKVDRQVSMIYNNTSIQEIFSKLDNKFDQLYAKRSFVHWFINRNFEESYFTEARENVASIEKDYEDYDGIIENYNYE